MLLTLKYDKYKRRYDESHPKRFAMTYVISALMTFLFSVIVMFFVHFRLKKIDMVEALKSYE